MRSDIAPNAIPMMIARRAGHGPRTSTIDGTSGFDGPTKP